MDFFNNFSNLVSSGGRTIDTTINTVSTSVNKIRDSLGFIEINESNNTNGLKVVRLIDEPFYNNETKTGISHTKVIHLYFTPLPFSKQGLGRTEGVRFIGATAGEPITYREIRPTDIEIQACAKNGTLILVLPDELPLMCSVKISRVDSENKHQMRVVAENARIDGKEKINLQPKDLTPTENNIQKDSNGNNGTMTLTKNKNDSWTVGKI